MRPEPCAQRSFEDESRWRHRSTKGSGNLSVVWRPTVRTVFTGNNGWVIKPAVGCIRRAGNCKAAKVHAARVASAMRKRRIFWSLGSPKEGGASLFVEARELEEIEARRNLHSHCIFPLASLYKATSSAGTDTVRHYKSFSSWNEANYREQCTSMEK